LKSGMMAGETAVSERLTAIMERQAVLAGRRGSDYTGMYRQAEYVMAVLADEILLHQIDWPGKQAWNDHLMEYRLFRTRIAGEEFFRRLDRLLQTPDPFYTDLATVYLMAIMLGFRGKYFGRTNQADIAVYRLRLFSFIFNGQPELKRETKKLFPEAYLHTVEAESRHTRLPRARIWGILFAALVAIYIFIARWIWIRGTAELENSKNRIEQLLP